MSAVEGTEPAMLMGLGRRGVVRGRRAAEDPEEPTESAEVGRDGELGVVVPLRRPGGGTVSRAHTHTAGTEVFISTRFRFCTLVGIVLIRCN